MTTNNDNGRTLTIKWNPEGSTSVRKVTQEELDEKLLTWKTEKEKRRRRRVQRKWDRRKFERSSR